MLSQTSSPPTAESFLQIAFQLLEKNQYTEASYAAEVAIELNPQYHDAYLIAAVSASSLGKYDIAENHFRKALALAPNLFDNNINLGIVLSKQGKLDDAIEQFAHCLEMNPSDQRIYNELGSLLNRLNRTDRLLALCQRYLAQWPEDKGYRLLLADVIYRQGDIEAAENEYQKLITAHAFDHECLMDYARFLVRTKAYDKAESFLKKAIEISSNDLRAYIMLADLYTELNERPKALRVFIQAQPLLKDDHWSQRLRLSMIFHQFPEIYAAHCQGNISAFDEHPDLSGRDYGEVIELFMVAYGVDHCAFLEDVAFPALWCSEGFQDLCKERTVVANIYGQPQDQERLERFFHKLRSCGIAIRMNTQLLDTKLVKDTTQDAFALLVLPLLDQITRSLNHKSIIMMALPDMIVAGGSLANVLRTMKPEEFVVAPGPRISAQKAYRELAGYFRLSDQPLNLPKFVQECFSTYLHTQNVAAMHTTNPMLEVEQDSGAYIGRFAFPQPLCFYATPEMIEIMLYRPACGYHALASFFAIDHDFINLAYANNRLRCITDSREFFLAEFTYEEKHNAETFLAGWGNENYYYPPSAQYLFDKKIYWRTEK